MHRRDAKTIATVLMLGTVAACQNDPASEEGFIAMDDGTSLYYRAIGAGSTTLVIPAALYLADALAPLAEHNRVVFYDPRNRGRSDRAPLETISLDRQIEDLEILRQRLRLDSMALLGWSGLGMELAAYAIRYPERVTRFIQVSAVPPAAQLFAEATNPTGDDSLRTAIRELERQFDAGEFGDRPAEFCREYNALTLPLNFVDTALVSEVADVCEHPNEWPVNLWPYFEALLGSFGDYDWRPDLEKLGIARLVIHGREDRIPFEGGRAWAAGYQNVKLIAMSPAGHFPFLEHREQFFLAVNRFLQGYWPHEAEVVDR